VIRMVALSVLAAVLLVAAGCGTGGASDAATAFAAALADSSYSDAWTMITPESRALYDSTVAILHQFGWTESRESVIQLAGEMTESEFDSLTGEELFTRMVVTAPEVHNLSTSVQSVSYPDTSTGVVVMRTDEGLQEIVARRTGGIWLIDLTSLTPPLQEGE
jgi:ABC-type glycerol-3-phosphate transport system substrate-binding protein